MKAVRTKNDAKGLHNAWNKSAGRKMRFFRLVDFLEELSAVVTLEMELLTHDCIKLQIRESTKLKLKALFDLWDQYQANKMNTLQHLNKITTDLPCIYSPCETSDDDLYNFYDTEEDDYDCDLFNYKSNQICL